MKTCGLCNFYVVPLLAVGCLEPECAGHWPALVSIHPGRPVLADTRGGRQRGPHPGSTRTLHSACAASDRSQGCVRVWEGMGVNAETIVSGHPSLNLHLSELERKVLGPLYGGKLTPERTRA